MGKLGSLVDGLLLDIGFTKLRTAGTAYSNFNHRYFRSSFVFVVEFIVYHRFYRSIEEKLKILTFFFLWILRISQISQENFDKSKITIWILETLGKRFTGRYKYLENFDSFGTLQVYTESIILFLHPSSRGNFRNFDFLKTLQVKFKIAKSEFRGY